MTAIRIGDQVRHPDGSGTGTVIDVDTIHREVTAEFADFVITDAPETFKSARPPALTESDTVALLGLGEEDRDQFNDGEEDG
jgi:hypothetical protein